MNAYLLTGDKRDQENYRASYRAMVTQLDATVETARSDPYRKDFLSLTNLIARHINFTRSLVQARERGGEAAARLLAQSHPDGSMTNSQLPPKMRFRIAAAPLFELRLFIRTCFCTTP